MNSSRPKRSRTGDSTSRRPPPSSPSTSAAAAISEYRGNANFYTFSDLFLRTSPPSSSTAAAHHGAQRERRRTELCRRIEANTGCTACQFSGPRSASPSKGKSLRPSRSQEDRLAMRGIGVVTSSVDEIAAAAAALSRQESTKDKRIGQWGEWDDDFQFHPTPSTDAAVEQWRTQTCAQASDDEDEDDSGDEDQVGGVVNGQLYFRTRKARIAQPPPPPTPPSPTPPPPPRPKLVRANASRGSRQRLPLPTSTSGSESSDGQHSRRSDCTAGSEASVDTLATAASLHQLGDKTNP